MKSFKALVAGMLGSFAISTAALAADVIIIPPPAPPPPMAVAPAGYDWGGLYAGAGILTEGAITFTGQVGFNIDNGGLVFGAEVFVIPAGGLLVGVEGRVGFALGASRNILAYAAGGVVFAGGVVPLVGGGAAIGIGEKLSVFGEALFIPGAGCCIFRAGANFQFGN